MPTNDVLCSILGGGRGRRLWPLTSSRAKPAVPIGGKYRLIDIPPGNCLSSGMNRIAVLTRFNSVSLNRHVAQTYHFDLFQKGWVQVLAAEQTERGSDRDQSTADADVTIAVKPISRIRDAIVDKNARIGENVRIEPFPSGPDRDGERWSVRDGIVVVSKNAMLPSGTVIAPE